MRKSLLTFAVLAMASVLNLSAQSWTASEVATGEFYLYNVGAKAYLSHGATWNTHAQAYPNEGILTNITALEDGNYTIGTNSYYSGRYFTANDYVDSKTATEWTFEEQNATEHTYKLIDSESQYAYAETTYNTQFCIVTGDDPGTDYSLWKLVTKDELLKDAENNASTDNPIEVSALYLTNPNFATGSTDGWTNNNIAVGGNKNNDASRNFDCERYHNTSSLYQTVSGLPTGKYKLTVSGLTRDSETDFAQLYINDSEANFMLHQKGAPNYPNDMSAAAESFDNGEYPNEVVGLVTDGTAKVGVKNDYTTTWFIFDTFRLFYMGKVIASEAQEMPSDGNLTADTWYKYTVSLAGDYAITATDATKIEYTNDGDQTLTGYSAEVCSETVNLEAGTYYFKSSEAQTLTIAAAQKTYAVGAATITPADGSYVSSLTTVTIAFPEAVTNDPDAKLAVLNESGVTCGEQTATLSMEGNTLTATFEGLTLDLNSSYTVSIAAGTVGYEGQVTNEEASATYKTGIIAEGTYYLQKSDENRFISSGGNWAAEAIVSEYGAAFTFELQSNGTYHLMNTFYNASYGSSYGLTNNGCYTDGTAVDYTLEAVGDGTYYLKCGDSYIASAEEGTYKYSYLINADQASAYTWKLLTRAEYDAAVLAKKNAEVAALAETAGVTASTTEELEQAIEGKAQMSLTYKIQNPDYAAADGWDFTQTNGGGRYYEEMSVAQGCEEIYDANGAFSQTITGLSEGLYKVTVDAFQRPGTYEGGVASADVFTPTSWLYANDSKTQLVNWATVDAKVNDRTGFVANADAYENSVYVYVNEGEDLTIGIKAIGWYGGSWVAATNWTLTQYSDKVTIDEAVAYEPIAQTADVTLNRTLKGDGTWNTFCLPFAISNDELKAAFGDDAVVAEFTSFDATTGMEYTTMETPAIKANTPVLLKSNTTASSFDFTNRAIEVSDPVVEQSGVSFVGIYTPVAAIYSADESRYVISGNKVHPTSSETATALKGTRAYIAAPAGTEVKIRIDGEEATAINGINGTTNYVTGGIYTLSGQRVNSVVKGGLYIVNGKKVMVK